RKAITPFAAACPDATPRRRTVGGCPEAASDDYPYTRWAVGSDADRLTVGTSADDSYDAVVLPPVWQPARSEQMAAPVEPFHAGRCAGQGRRSVAAFAGRRRFCAFSAHGDYSCAPRSTGPARLVER